MKDYLVNTEVSEDHTADPMTWRTVTAETMQDAVIESLQSAIIVQFPVEVWVADGSMGFWPNGRPRCIHAMTVRAA